MTGLSGILLNMTVCLLLTAAAEGILIFIITRKARYIWYSAVCTLITNPALNLIMFISGAYSGASAAEMYILLAALEAAAVMTEALFYRMLLRRRLSYTLPLSLALNAASFAAGVLLLWS